jgi:predicted O-methyltransferase YrrM
MKESYVHGYNERENTRLHDQASTLAELLHTDTRYPAKSRILEAGCGTGAQTVTLAGNSPDALFVSMDISASSLATARDRIRRTGIGNVIFYQADIAHPPYATGSFDHAFLCFVLEHLKDPDAALRTIRSLLKPGGTITVIEGDHGSAYFYPDSAAAQAAINCQVELQRRAGGNALIGRELFPLLQAAGYDSVSVSPRMVYVDGSRQHLVEGFTRNTFTAMIRGVREAALAADLSHPAVFDRGISDLYRTTESDGVFCYTFFKATARCDR